MHNLLTDAWCCRNIEKEIGEHKHKIKYLKSYLWRQWFFGRIKTIIKIYSIRKKIKELNQELQAISSKQ